MERGFLGADTSPTIIPPSKPGMVVRSPMELNTSNCIFSCRSGGNEVERTAVDIQKDPFLFPSHQSGRRIAWSANWLKHGERITHDHVSPFSPSNPSILGHQPRCARGRLWERRPRARGPVWAGGLETDRGQPRVRRNWSELLGPQDPRARVYPF